MPIYLKQSTASQEIPLGYFVDSTDGNTEETGLTINNTDILVWKSGATTLAAKHSGGATHISNGIYYAVLDATDTDTLGSLVIFVHVTGALTVRVECVVLAANVYDSMIGGGDVLDVSATQFAGQTITCAGSVTVPAATLASTTNITSASGVALAADQAVNVTKVNGTAQTARDLGASVLISPGTGVGQLDVTSGVIKANLAQILGTALTETAGQIAAAFKKVFDVAGPVFTASSVNQTGDAFARIGAAGASLTALGDTRIANLDATVSSRSTLTAAGVWDALLTGIATVGSIGKLIKDNLDAAITSRLAPTVAARTLDVSATGEAGMDWSNIGAPTTTVNLSGTTVKTATDVETDTADLQNRLPAALVGGRIDASVGAVANDAITAAAIATGAIDADAIADNAIDAGAIAIGAITNAKFAAGAIDAAAIATGAIDADAIADNAIDAGAIATDAIDGDAMAASAVTKIQAGLSTLTAANIWDALLTGITTAGSIGKLIKDYLDAAISSRLASGSYIAPDNATITAINAKTTNLPASPAATGDIPSAAANADAVWNEAIADHLGAGSTGAALNAAGSAGDPWSTLLPGLYGIGTAGKIVGDNLNATISSRSTLTAAGVWDALLTGITAVGSIGKIIKDYLDAAITSRLASGSYTAPDNATIATINAKTTNLPANPAATSDIPSAATVADAVWNEAIADHLGAGSTGTALNSASAPTAAQVADAVWDETMADHVAAGSTGAKLNSVAPGAALNVQADITEVHVD